MRDVPPINIEISCGKPKAFCTIVGITAIAARNNEPGNTSLFKIFCKYSSVLSVDTFMKKISYIEYDKQAAVQGFLTDNDTFVDRYEAFEIACAAGQLLPEAKEEYKDKIITQLFSEDVW